MITYSNDDRRKIWNDLQIVNYPHRVPMSYEELMAYTDQQLWDLEQC